jgi:hypothetical protein
MKGLYLGSILLVFAVLALALVSISSFSFAGPFILAAGDINITINKSVLNSGPVFLGENASFIVNITNIGNHNITNITMMDIYDVDLNYTNASTQPNTVNYTSRIVYWTTNILSSNLTANSSMAVYVNMSAIISAVSVGNTINVSTMNATETRNFSDSTSFRIYNAGISATSPSNQSYANATISFNVTLSDNATLCNYTLDSTNYTMANLSAANSSYSSTNSTMSEGAHSVIFLCNFGGRANSTSAVYFTVDTVLPGITINSPANTTYNTSSRNFNVTANENVSSCVLSLSNFSANYTMVVNVTGRGAGYTNSSMNSGAWTAKFACNDTAGNWNNTEQVVFTVDITPPNITIISPTNHTFYNSTITINITNDTTANTVWWGNSTNNYTYTGVTTSVFASGAKIINAYANDSLGNLNQTNISFTVNTDPHFEMNGTVYDVNGSALNNSNISILIRNQSWSQIAQNYTAANSSGWFAINLTANSTYMYQLSVTHRNSTTNAVDFVGQSLPSFPYQEFSQITHPSFYMKPGGTMNITAVNRSGVSIPNNEFAIQVKDKRLGFPISSCAASGSYDYICYVPSERNYSIMIYPADGSPQHFVPVSFNWDNFSAAQSYNITTVFGTNQSRYNATTKTLAKQFDVTESFARITGYINGSTLGITNWSELTVVPFLLEPGNMIFMTYGILPFNVSSWDNSQTDVYNLSSGFYNITVPYAPTETVTYMLFAAAKNDSAYYGSYRNITISGNAQANFTMYGLLGSNSTITMNTATGGSRVVNTTRQTFRLVNATTNATLDQTSAHIETAVDYSNYGAMQFTFMEDISQQGSANFSLPMLNVTGYKELNVFSQTLSPKRVSTKTAAQIIANSNISMSSFNPEAVSGSFTQSINISAYRSNSSCDVPNPPSGCLLSSFTPSNAMGMLSIVVGGGAISLRISYGNISVHYANVDLLASGPPSADFESSATTSTTGSFSAAMKFGSQGPTIYDYVLIAIPYTEGSTSQTGLNESAETNMSIPLFYDESWTAPIWNASANGSNASIFAGNHSHYSSYQSQWQTLMNNNTCYPTAVGNTTVNSSAPCNIQTDSNKIWVRLPHFSGTQPSVTGNVITATTSSDTGTTSGGGGGGGAAATDKTKSKSYEPAQGQSLASNAKLQSAVASILAIEQLSEQAKQNMLVFSASIAQNTKVNRSFNSSGGKTAVTTKITYSGQAAKNLMVYDKVPKAFASSNTNITTTAVGAVMKVVEEDPEYLFMYSDISNGQELSITYKVSSDLNTTILDSFAAPEFYAESVGGANATGGGVIVCTPGDKRCSANDLQACSLDGAAWTTEETCVYGCENGSCREAPVVSAANYTMYIIGAIIVVVIIILLVVLRTGRKK